MKAKKYAAAHEVHPEETAFHKSIIENPYEATTFLAYADWLEENNRPGMATAIREAVKHRQEMEQFRKQQWEERGGEHGLIENHHGELNEQGPYQPRPIARVSRIGNDKYPINPEQLQQYLNTWHINHADAVHHDGNKIQLGINHIMPHNPDYNLYYSFYTDRPTSTHILRQIANEGHRVYGINREYDPDRNSDHERAKSDLTRNVLVMYPEEPTQLFRKKYAIPKPYTTPSKSIVSTPPKNPKWVTWKKVSRVKKYNKQEDMKGFHQNPDENINRQVYADFLEDNNIAPNRYAAYRAPAGGMVVRGTYYKGGKMIPNMQGKFMNPPTSKKKSGTLVIDPARMAAIKKKVRKTNKIGGVVRKLPDALPSAPSGGDGC